MADVDPLDQLRAKYPVFQFRNKTNSAHMVQLADGDSVQVHARGTLKLKSSQFNNLPDNTKFSYDIPSVDDLREVGLIPTISVQDLQAKKLKKTEPASDSE